MTNDEKRAAIVKIVTEFTINFLNQRLRQIGQVVPGADDDERVQIVVAKLYEQTEDSLHWTMEPREWLTMALYGAGLIEEDIPEMYEICQGLAEWLFAIPNSNHYQIPDFWYETDLGALWAQAFLRVQGDQLITIAEAAKLAGVTPQAISGRIDRGTLRAYIDPLSAERQGRRLVSRNDIKNIQRTAKK